MELFAETADAAERLTLGGFHLQSLEGYEVAVPTFTRSMAADLAYRTLPPERAPVELMAPLIQPGTDAWVDYFSTRKVVAREDSAGKRLLSVTSNLADATGRVVRQGPGDAAGLARAKKYDLVSMLTDASLVDKFRVQGEFRAKVRNIAAVDSARAARELQNHVRTFEGYERATVEPGSYSTSWKAARDSLKMFASRFPAWSVTTEALFVGKLLFIYGPEGEEGWRVFGPESVASLIRLVHRIVAATSCESVAFSLGPELTILDIDIHDGFEVLCPVREGHVGDHAALKLPPVGFLHGVLSNEVRSTLESLGAACGSLAVDGVECATAVRVSSSYVLLNSHVVGMSGQLTVDSVPVHPLRMLSRDLWIGACRGDGVVWRLREAEPGESVVLTYRYGGKLVHGGPVRVVGGGGDLITLEKSDHMQPGVSGAAVISLTDFSLLGVYDGVTLRNGIAATFSQAMHTEVCAAVDADSESHVSARDDGGGVFQKMQERGLGKVVRCAMESVVPLYAHGQHVGLASFNGSALYTPCDPSVNMLAGDPDGPPYVFQPARNGLYSVEAGIGMKPPAVARSPAYGEKVFVVGRDAEGPYCDLVDSNVVHVGVGAEVFQVSVGDSYAHGLPLAGALVVARLDGAVLGVLCSPLVARSGARVWQASVFPQRSAKAELVETPTAAVSRVFPFLRPSLWPEGQSEAALAHASYPVSSQTASQLALAAVGDCAMRLQLSVHLLESGVPTSLWQKVIQRLQSNAAQASISESLGLSECVRVGKGVMLGKGCKTHADVLEAVAGAVYLYEPADTFAQFCLAVSADQADLRSLAAG